MESNNDIKCALGKRKMFKIKGNYDSITSEKYESVQKMSKSGRYSCVSCTPIQLIYNMGGTVGLSNLKRQCVLICGAWLVCRWRRHTNNGESRASIEIIF